MKKFFLNNNNILVLIVLNSLLILHFSFSEVEPNIWLMAFDYLFTFLFVIEMIVKISTYKKDFFKSKSNVFDLILITISAVSIPFSFGLDFILIFRLLRLFICFRLYKMIPNYGQLIKNFKLALKASVGVILAIFVIIFILGIMLCYFYRESTPEYFGTPLDSIYTVFTLFSTEGWSDITNNTAHELSPFWKIITKYFFIFIVFIGGMLGMSIVTSFFTDAMAQNETEDILNKIKDLKEIQEEILNKINDYGKH